MNASAACHVCQSANNQSENTKMDRGSSKYKIGRNQTTQSLSLSHMQSCYCKLSKAAIPAVQPMLANQLYDAMIECTGFLCLCKEQ